MDSVEEQLTNVFCIDNVSKSDSGNYFRYLKEELYVYRILGFNFINISKYILVKINYIIRVICVLKFSMIFVVNLFIYEEKLLSIYMTLMSIIFLFSVFIYLFFCL